jgi:hypothetical protein
VLELILIAAVLLDVTDSLGQELAQLVRQGAVALRAMQGLMFTRMLELALMELMEHVATQLTIAITNAILQDAAGQRVSQGVLSAMNVLVD